MYLTMEAGKLGKAVRMSRSNYVSSHLSRPHHQFTSYNYLSQKKTPSFTEAEEMGAHKAIVAHHAHHYTE